MLLTRDMSALHRIRARRAEMAAVSPNAINVRTGMTAAEEYRKDFSPAPASNHSGGFDPEKFGEAIGELIRETVEPLQKRIAELEKQAGERRRSLSFKGEFQRALDYTEGDIVTRNDRIYLATKDMPAGDQLRDGMHGWVLMFKGVS
ncbi:hypothetical protein [Variovorax soli]|uniref:Uncharacterized protein n=1 Tax=Variovorax soli TaxID=376815 RepID=A0ABU1NAX9_9BURK|nr:hypothetical protein [Variovorax soli]MDR6535595.1 hypothetical protein [Variovorax soli]